MQDYSISPRGKVRYLEADRGFGTPCWEWQMHCDNSGYGRIRIGRLHMAAHRYYFELYRGPVGDNLQLDHLCRNRKCVNPDHLEVVTMVENIRRGNVAKLTPVQVSEILALKGHETAKEVGQRFGVVRSTISRIWSGDRWSGILQQEHELSAEKVNHTISRAIATPKNDQNPRHSKGSGKSVCRVQDSAGCANTDK